MTVAQNSIVELYVIYFNRAPDPNGLTFWQTQDITIEEMAAQFGASPEAKSLYPFLEFPSLADPEAFINSIYQNAFGRDAEQAGLDFWIGVLEDDSSPETVAEFVLTVAQAAQGTDLGTLQNRAEIALLFTQTGVAEGATFDAPLLQTSSQIINTVTFEEDSVANAEDLIIAAFNDITPPGTNPITLLGFNAVLTGDASLSVAPAGAVLTTANDTVRALTFIDSAFIEDPSTTDNDTLTAQVISVFTGVNEGGPSITNIENIELTGSGGTGIGTSINLSNISGAKAVTLTNGNLIVIGTDNQALTLGKGFKSQVDVVTEDARTSQLILNGTAGAKVLLRDFVGPTFDPVDSDLEITVVADSKISALIDFQADQKTKTASNVIILGDKDLTIDGTIELDNFADPGKDVYARLDASGFKGSLTVITDGKSTNQLIDLVGGLSDDTFNLTKFGPTTLTKLTAINGNNGFDTLTVQGTAGNAFDFVSNIEKIVFVNSPTAIAPTLTAKNTLVAPGETLQIDGSGLNINNFLTVDGSLETDGSFIITGGAASDKLTGGDKNDTLTGNDSGFLGNELTGNKGSDRFVLNQAQEIAPLTPKTTITDFKAGVDGDVFAISVSAYAGAPAAGSVFKVSTVDAAVNLSTTVLVENGLIGTNTSALTNVRFGVDTATNILYYDANGNFASGSIAIAKSDLALTGLTNNNFIAIA